MNHIKAVNRKMPSITVIILLLSILNFSCLNSSESNRNGQNITSSSRCVQASMDQLRIIQDGVKQIEDTNYVNSAWAVKSQDFENVWMVAAIIYGPGIENGTGPGVWAISGDPSNPGMTLSVNGYAKEFSTWPDASKTDAGITISDDGVQEAINCAENKR